MTRYEIIDHNHPSFEVMSKNEQVKTLILEYMDDGKAHSMRDIRNYVDDFFAGRNRPLTDRQVVDYAMRKAIKEGFCSKIRHGVYQSHCITTDSTSACIERAKNIYQNFFNEMDGLLTGFQYLTGTPQEQEIMEKLRDCFQDIMQTYNKFNSLKEENDFVLESVDEFEDENDEYNEDEGIGMSL